MTISFCFRDLRNNEFNIGWSLAHQITKFDRFRELVAAICKAEKVSERVFVGCRHLFLLNINHLLIFGRIKEDLV